MSINPVFCLRLFSLSVSFKEYAYFYIMADGHGNNLIKTICNILKRSFHDTEAKWEHDPVVRKASDLYLFEVYVYVCMHVFLCVIHYSKPTCLLLIYLLSYACWTFTVQILIQSYFSFERTSWNSLSQSLYLLVYLRRIM